MEEKSTKPSVTLGYVILYVENVAVSMEFYEKAFGLKRRFLLEDGAKFYGELDTGAARLAFASLTIVEEQIEGGVITTTPEKAPLSFEVVLVTNDVQGLYDSALKAGAVAMTEPAQKPWGQTVAYVRDIDGHIVELCTALP